MHILLCKLKLVSRRGYRTEGGERESRAQQQDGRTEGRQEYRLGGVQKVELNLCGHK